MKNQTASIAVAAAQDRDDRRPHVVVIGAGVGGLAAAIRLGAKGYRVTVLDRLDAPGGRAYTYRQDGYTFDAGPTIITAPYIFEELWSLCGQRMADHVELRASDPFYRIHFDDGAHFTYSGDHAAMRAEVARLSPGDVDGYDRYLRASGEIYKVAFEQLAHKPFHSLGFTLRAAADLIRLRGYRSVYSRVSEFFRNEHLRTVFSFHPLLIGGNPFTATSYYCLIAHLESKYGVHYAVGGTGALVRGMVDLIGHTGGSVRCNAEVDRILVRAGRATGVALAGGEEIAADVVVSNAEPAWTYGRLLRDHPRRRWTDAKLARARHSMGLVVWYFGTDRRFDDVLHHNMILGPRYRGLLDDIFHRHKLADDCSLYLHRPTASDPSLAPPGCDAFYVLSPVPNLASGTDWPATAERYRAQLQQRLESTLLPGLGRSIVYSHMLTPQDFRDRYLSLYGAGFAMEPRLLQSAWFRPHNRSEEVEGLYLVGAGTHPGAGLPGVVSSARVLDSLLPHASCFARGPR
jgi:phytoene desaturase